MSRVPTLVGAVYGAWVVLGDAPRDSQGRKRWRVLCTDCTREVERDSYSIRRGTSSGCVCHHQAHGRSRVGDLTYASWQAMRTRCLNPNAADYPRYGGCGVTIDPAWDSFERFYADVGPRLSRDLTLDRIDPYGNYTKSNCRWADRQVQRHNQRQHKRSVKCSQIV